MLPLCYKILPNNAKRIFSGKISGSGQPGFKNDADNDLKILASLKKGKSIEEANVDKELLAELNGLYDEGIRTIYSLAHYAKDRNPELLKLLWERKVNTRYITEINGVSIEVDDFTAPTQDQLKLITQDVIERMENGEHVLVHCGAGVGRTGTVLAAIEMLAHEQYDLDQAKENIRRDYEPRAVEEENQREALKKFSTYIQKLKIEQILGQHSATIKERNNALVLAINLNLPNKIADLLSCGAQFKESLLQVNKRGKENAMKFALGENNTMRALECFAAGADINTQNDDKKSLLSLAISNNDYDLIARLCQNNQLNLNLKDAEGKTPLLKATESGNELLIKKLILSGAMLTDLPDGAISIDKLESYWKEALETSNFIAVKNFSKTYPNFLNKEINGLSPIKYVLNIEKKDLYTHMVALGLSIDSVDTNIARTILSEKPYLIKDILSQGLSLKAFLDENGKLPTACEEYWNKDRITQTLKAAIDANNISLSCNLLELDPSAKDYFFSDQKPLSYALSQQKDDLDIELAKSGFRNEDYLNNLAINNALILSINFENEEQVGICLKEGADIKEAEFGNICLIEAIKGKNLAIVKMLIEAGVSLNHKTRFEDKTALMYAIEVDNAMIIDLIIKHSTPEDLQIVNDDNKTALMYAVIYVHPSTIAALIQAGADVNQVEEDSSALMEAVINKKPAILEILLTEYNANPNLKDNNSETALMKATDPNIIKILLKHGADLDDIDSNQKLVLERLVKNCGQNIIKTTIEIVQTIGNQDLINKTKKSIHEYVKKNIESITKKNNSKLLKDSLELLIDLDDQELLSTAMSIVENSNKQDLIDLACTIITIDGDTSSIETTEDNRSTPDKSIIYRISDTDRSTPDKSTNSSISSPSRDLFDDFTDSEHSTPYKPKPRNANDLAIAQADNNKTLKDLKIPFKLEADAKEELSHLIKAGGLKFELETKGKIIGKLSKNQETDLKYR